MSANLDFRLFTAVNGLAGLSAIADRIGAVAAQYFPLVTVASLVYLWATADSRSARERLLLDAYAILLALLINFLITLVYYRPRPFAAGVGTQLIPHGAETSFPSDHATIMFAAALMLLALPGYRKAGSLLTAVAVTGGFLRVFAGVHFPSDILGSFGVGLAAAWLIFSMRKRLIPVSERLLGIAEKVGLAPNVDH